MAIDWTTVLGGLGATVAAFGDPRQSLMMSQGIMQRNQQMRERKEREERQRQELALRQQRVAMEQAQAQAEAARRQAGMQLLAQDLDPNAGAQLAAIAPAVYSPGQSAVVPTTWGEEQVAVSAAINDPTGQTPFPFVPQPRLKPGVFAGTPGQQRGALPSHVTQHARTLVALGDDKGAAKVIADAREQQRKEAMPLDPTAKQRNWTFAQGLPPGQREEFLGQGGVNVDVNLAEQARNNPYRAHPMYGEAKDGEAFDWVPPGERAGVKTDRFGYRLVTDDRGTYPKMISAKPGQPSAEEVKMRGLINAGYGSLKKMREIVGKTDWDLVTRGTYLFGIPGTEGDELRRNELDVYDAISKGRTGAASNKEEQNTYRRIYGLSVIHSREDVTKRLGHMERSLRAYDDARKRLGIDSEEPLPADVDAEIMERTHNDPDINPYALEGLKFIGHAQDGSGVEYELPSGRRVIRRYNQFK